MLINIIGRQNSAGLSADIKILTTVLECQGWKVHFSDYKSMKRFSFGYKKYYDINIFLQWANPTWLKIAKKNILIPNPEWFKDKWLHVIGKFDAIFCKTRAAEEIFRHRNKNTFFISFTSIDQHLSDICKENKKWIHVAGKSKLKGTDIIIKTWLNNPEFPHLTVLQRNTENHGELAPNLTCISELVDKDQLREWMNRCSVHLCTSATEGFGHYIGEALSCGAIIISTDAPPMNELVDNNRGFLVKPVAHHQMKLATAYQINQTELENTVKKTMAADNYDEMMGNARGFFVSNDLFFKNEIVRQIEALIS
jgi:glycosyltransferase involved in cell wall biosynthesis